MNKQSLFSNFTNALLCTSAVWAHTVSSSSTTNLLSLKSLYLQTAWIRTILHTTFKRSNCVELEFNFTSFTKRLEASFMAPAGTVSTTVRLSLGATCACVETKKWNFARPDIWQLMWKIFKKKNVIWNFENTDCEVGSDQQAQPAVERLWKIPLLTLVLCTHLYEAVTDKFIRPSTSKVI